MKYLVWVFLLSSFTAKCKPNCAWQCRNNVCELDREGAWTCSEGCLERLTGKYCQELCPKKCVTCEQFRPTCTSCEKGFKGEDCKEPDGISTTVVTANRHTGLNYTTTGCQNGDCEDVTFTNRAEAGNRGFGNKVSSINGNAIALSVGVAAAVVFIVVALIVFHKLKKRRKCNQRGHRQRGTRNDTDVDRDSGMYKTYDYIDDVSLASYYSSLHSPRSKNLTLQESYPDHKKGTHAVPESEIQKYLNHSK